MAILDFATGFSSALIGNTANFVGGVPDGTQNGHYVLEGIEVINQGIRDKICSLSWTPRTEVWISYYHYQGTRDTTINQQEIPPFMIEGLNANGDLRRYVYFDVNLANDNRVDLVVDGRILIPSMNLVPANNTRTRVDVHIKMDAVNGEADVWFNQTLVGTFRGDTSDVELTEFDRCSMGFSGDWDFGGFSLKWSAAFAADEESVGITMVQHEINGNGNLQQMSGGYTDINTLNAFDDVTRLESNATNQTSTFTKGATPPIFGSGYEIIALGLSSRAAVGAANSINNISHVIDDLTNTIESPNIPVDQLIQPRKHLFTTAPDGGAWTAAKLDATQVGVKSKA